MKKHGNKNDFWQHYHHIVELSEEGNQELYIRLDNYLKDDIVRHFIISNIPKKYFSFEWESLKDSIGEVHANDDAVNKIDKYLNSISSAAEKGIGVYLHGDHGVAKTTVASIFLKEAVKQFYKCYFMKATSIVEFIRAGWKNESRREFFEYIISKVDFLVIDDIARLFDNQSEAEKSYIDKIFTQRDDQNLVTIITANHDISENLNIFGTALTSNFNERLIPIHLHGTDFRKTIGENLLEELK